MEKRTSARAAGFKLALLFCLLVMMVLIGLFSGAVKLSPGNFIEILSGGELSKGGRILLYVRIPRVAGAVVAGAALSVAGAVIQMVLNNPLAGPNIIGVNAGSGFFVVLCGFLLPDVYGILPLAAFLGAFMTVVLVYYLGRKTGSSKITLVLAGVAINSLLNSASDVIYTIHEESLITSNMFKIGGLNGINSSVLLYASIVALAAFLILLFLSNELEVFSLGEDKAKTLGMPVSFYRFLFLALAAAMAGAAVSFAGLLGFVGLIVPHMARIFVGEECRYFIPASALTGALLLLVCDYIARTWFAPYELPVGILLSFVGGPFFLYMLFGRKRGNRNA